VGHTVGLHAIDKQKYMLPTRHHTPTDDKRKRNCSQHW